MLLLYLSVTIILKISHAFLAGEPDYNRILYGGVLRVKEYQDTYVESQNIIQFAVSFLKTRYHFCDIPESELKKISTIKRQTLFYTYNNETPYLVNISGTLHPVEFGTLRKFSLQWTCEENVSVHNFTIVTYPQEMHHVYSHTFEKVSEISNLTASLNDGGEMEWKIVEPGCMKTWIPSDFLMNRSRKMCKWQCVESFRVMTYNIWNMNTFTKHDQDYPVRFSLLTKILRDHDPDVIAFQEVRYEHFKGSNLGPNQIKHLSNVLKDHQYVYAPGQLDKHSIYNGKTEEGVAVFSRFPILAQSTFLLFRNRSNSADLNQRACLHVQIQHPQHGVVHVLTTHMSLSHEAREESVVQIWGYIKGLRGHVILTGDFNAEPQEKAMRFLRGEISLKGEKTSCLVDLWSYIYSKSQGFTFNSAFGELKKRIDYIFWWQLSGNLQVNDIKTCQQPGKGSSAASDHLPVVATFC